MNIILEPTINVYSREEFRSRVELLKDLVDLMQIDVIDGKFAQPSNFVDLSTVERELSSRKIHVHLMVNDIAKALGEWLPLVPRRITMHVEASRLLERYLMELQERRIGRGIALSPATPLEQAVPFVPMADFLLLVSVPPGRSGQTFSPTTIERVKIMRKKFPHLDIGVDGGVTEELLVPLVKAGVSSIAIGSAIFAASDPRERYKQFKDIIDAISPS